MIYDSHDNIMMPPKPFACVQELLPAKFLLNSFRSKILAQNIFEDSIVRRYSTFVVHVHFFLVPTQTSTVALLRDAAYAVALSAAAYHTPAPAAGRRGGTLIIRPLSILD